MKHFFNLFLVCLLAAPVGAFPAQSNNYQYTLDLVGVQDDRVTVELITPKIEKNRATFYLPKIIPGTYTVYDFGRFVTGFQAFDAGGNPLPVDHPEVNTWKIRDAKKLYRIVYQVDDTFDATGGKAVSGMSGTNIEAGKNFLLNGHGFYGYFEGMEFLPFEVRVKKPEGFVHQSAYEEVQEQDGEDLFAARDYHHLVDMPVMYCRPDTALIQLGETEVLVAVYSPNDAITSEKLRERYATLLQSQQAYLGGELPVNRYAFLMYFMGEQLPIGTGALEHNYSSVYCLPEYPFEQIAPFLVDIASHEFFHIITPLNVHSEEIHYFDFNDPDMSRHLWMYEGVTEYFSHHNQVRSGMISQEAFLQRMGQKIQISRSNYDDELAFTTMSRKVLDKYESEFANVYEKGALIAMCLDIELLRLSGGEMGIVDLMELLSEEYGSRRPFKDKKIIREITDMTYPEIGAFFQQYVEGNSPIPYGAYFAKAGVDYTPPRDTLVYSFGNVEIGLNQETGRLVVVGTYSLNEMGREMGYEVGDELVSIGGESIPSAGLQDFIDEVRSSMREGELFQVTVARKDGDGKEHQVRLQAVTKRIKQVLPPEIRLSKTTSTAQQALRKAWLGEE